MMAENTYEIKEEDFVFAPPEMINVTEQEAIGGVKHEALKRFFAKRSALVGVIILAVLVVLALIGPYLTGQSFDAQNLSEANLAPGAAHLFGTDNLGRDLFARCFMGLRISLIIALVATVINLIIGMNFGIISGYFGGMTDILMQRIIDVVGSIPTLVIVTLLMLVLKPGMGSIIFALMLSGWIDMSRIARAEVLKVKELEYVQAARTMGAGHGHIIFREIVPNIIGKLATQIMLSIPSAVFLEAFLSFVGLGMPAGTCSLGTLLSDGFANALLHPYKLFPAAIIMILLMMGCHMVAEGVKKATE